MISVFRREVDENWAIPGCYATSSDNLLPMFRHNISVPSSMSLFNSHLTLVEVTVEDGTDKISRNVGKKLPLFAS